MTTRMEWILRCLLAKDSVRVICLALPRFGTFDLNGFLTESIWHNQDTGIDQKNKFTSARALLRSRTGTRRTS